ncbi:MAG: mycothiol synthase [Acidimicrobiales bacterium]
MRRPETTHPSGAIALVAAGSDGPWLVPVEGGWELDLAESHTSVDPALRARSIATAVEAVAERGGGTVRLWVRGHDDPMDAAAVAAHMRLTRELLQMRRPLPVNGEGGLAVRPFRVGVDEAAWLEVNNRAFEWHPEQGHMTLSELQAHEAAPWFDPAGFLLHEDEGVLRGFCWTKIHPNENPPLGEIYVIAVDPSAHQRGLGRQLVLAGLTHLYEQGLQVGMLYTESDNAPAVRLYADLGFTVHSTDRAYVIDVPAR